MSLSSEHAAQLGVYAQLAVGFAGFAGVIGSFSKFRMHAEATAFRVRAMVVLALMEIVFSLLPGVVSSFAASAAVAWRISGGAFAAAGWTAVWIMARQANRLYKIGRLIRLAAHVLSGVAVLTLAPLTATTLGFAPGYAPACYFAGLFYVIIVCAYHFAMLMAAVRLDEQE